MRCVFILLLVALASCFSNNNQVNNRREILTKDKEMDAISSTKSTDTLSILKLSGKQYEEATFQILKRYYKDHDFVTIEIAKNNQLIKTINLPRQEEVKNFSIKI